MKLDVPDMMSPEAMIADTSASICPVAQRDSSLMDGRTSQQSYLGDSSTFGGGKA